MIDPVRFDTLFLDRDGVINILRPKDYVKAWEEFEFIPGSIEALRMLASRFRYIIVVTNQRGVGRGVMTEQDLLTIHNKMLQEIRRGGGRIDRIYVCTAVDDRDLNRKPNIGMALKAQSDFPDIDFSRSVVVGDSATDMEFGKRIGAACVWIGTGSDRSELSFESLYAFAEDYAHRVETKDFTGF